MPKNIMYFIRRLLPFAAIFFLIETILRAVLWRTSYVEAQWSELFHIFTIGFAFDLTVFLFFSIPYTLYLTCLPARRHGARFDRLFTQATLFLFAALILFGAIGEYLFWDEFTARFNFIAVDYLVYTTEVLANIKESYPLPLLFSVLGMASLTLCWLANRIFKNKYPSCSLNFRQRLAGLATVFVLCFSAYSAMDIRYTQWDETQTPNELSANGTYNLFHAYNNNELDYTHFYKTDNPQEVEKRIRELVQEHNTTFTNDENAITRMVRYPGPEKHKNVMLVVMESLSAEYMQSFGNQNNFTPNLDALAKQGLFFTNLYATGTRTVRGLEAVTLSVPPTPGQSIIRRPGNENLFSIGFVFKDRGYDTRFIYGGYGYFDNMNYFFENNGFEILDRAKMPSDEIHFANAWGVCDEDLYAQAIKAADKSFSSGKKFMHLIMTTSNHRPYTYPEGKIDIPPPGGRAGGVKYHDYAIGEFIRQAKTKPWFNDTLFVFVADHTASAAGKTELSLSKYHIPLIFYAPGFVKSARFENLASQIDTAPIMLGLLKFSYYSKFYGEDLLNDSDEIPHTFVSNYQKVAIVKKGQLVELSPKRLIEAYEQDKALMEKDIDASVVDDAVAYYQYAANWRERMKRLPTTIVNTVNTN
ncbi:MAG: alkaline phosphatase family protein [Alphaproteobacteria bacterium]|nr:MAG: alkaline phosphatase family protein [Alphaproteobacteria bacterium]